MLCAIDRLENAALIVRPERVSESAHVNHVCVLRVDYDAADLPRIVETDVMPRRSSVRGFIYSVARRQILSNVRLAGSGINRCGIGRSHCQRPNRGHGLTVKNRLPDNSRIGRLPDAAIDRAKIKSSRVARHSGNRNRAPSAKRANQAPFESVDEFRWNRLRRGAKRETQRDQKYKSTRYNTVCQAQSGFLQSAEPHFLNVSKWDHYARVSIAVSIL